MGCSNSNTNDEGIRKVEKIERVSKQLPREAETSCYVQGQDKGKDRKEKRGTNKTLKEYQLKNVNESALNVTTYYKDQIAAEFEGQWTDDIFPPNNNSVFGLKEDGSYFDPSEERVNGYLKSFKVKEEEVIWLRAKEIFGDFTLFESSISVDDIKQGSIGNCYFVSALSSLAETPQLILQLFRDLNVSEEGYYEIVFRLNGEWTVVLVDDWFPCDSNTRQPIFSRPVGNEIWVMLLEKAWAKVNGGYLNIIAGLPCDVLSVLTNFSTEYINHKDFLNDFGENELWNKLVRSSDNDDIVCCTSSFDSNLTKNVGIVGGHAFSLFKCVNLVLGNKNTKLLKIRNPWGHKEWNGKWSDGSKEWTKEAKSALNEFTQTDDGCFWIELSDYLKYFIGTDICMYNPAVITKTIKVDIDISHKAYISEIVAYDNINVTITVFKPHWRFNRGIAKNNNLQINLMLIKKIDNGKYEYVNSIHSNQESPSIVIKLEAGNYYIHSHCDFETAIKENNFDQQYPYIVSVGGDDYFDLMKHGIDEDYSVLRVGLISMIEKTRVSEFKSNNITILQANMTKTKDAYGYYFIKNSKNKEISFSLENCSTNMNLIYPTNSNPVTLKPGASFVAVGIRREFYSSFLFNFKFQTESDGTDFGFFENLDLESGGQLELELEDGFIFKKYNMDLSKFYKQINEAEASEGFYSSLYPEEMELLKKLQPLDDGVPVQFADKYEFEDGSWVFGESKVSDLNIRHGRGIFYWSTGTKFIGYNKNGIFEGPGEMIFSSTNKLKINFKNGKMDGEGVQVGENGEEYRCLYENGNFIQWL